MSDQFIVAAKARDKGGIGRAFVRISAIESLTVSDGSPGNWIARANGEKYIVSDAVAKSIVGDATFAATP